MTEGLLRQRRNLMAVSLALGFLKLGEVKISQLDVYGVAITFDNPHVLFVSLWLAWGYFALRYVQYFVQEGWPKLNKARGATLDDTCREKIKELVRPVLPPLSTDTKYLYTKLEKPKNLFGDYTFTGISVEKDQAGQPIRQEYAAPIKFRHLLRRMIFAHLKLLFSQSVAFDYLFPVLLAVAMFLYCFLGDWPGSIPNSFFDGKPTLASPIKQTPSADPLGASLTWDWWQIMCDPRDRNFMLCLKRGDCNACH